MTTIALFRRFTLTTQIQRHCNKRFVTANHSVCCCAVASLSFIVHMRSSFQKWRPYKVVRLTRRKKRRLNQKHQTMLLEITAQTTGDLFRRLPAHLRPAAVLSLPPEPQRNSRRYLRSCNFSRKTTCQSRSKFCVEKRAYQKNQKTKKVPCLWGRGRVRVQGLRNRHRAMRALSSAGCPTHRPPLPLLQLRRHPKVSDWFPNILI